MKARPPLQVGDLFQNQFEIRRLLGAGGYGFVYEAHDRTMARQIALKLIEIPTAERQKRACLEAQVTHKLTHPNIVRGYGGGVWTERWIYVELELLHGRSVGQALREHKTLSVLEAFLIAVQVADGMQAAHSAQIIHRDLKPDNIFLEHSNFARIIDFGVVKLVGPEAPSTQRNLIQGTSLYICPEQLLSGDVTERGDIFSLGVVLYEMIYGRCPALVGLEKDDLKLVTQNQILKPPKPLRKLMNWVPAYASRFVQRLLAKNPDERPSNMGEVVSGLQPLIERLRNESDPRVSGVRELSVPGARALLPQRSVSSASSVSSRRVPSQAPTKPACAADRSSASSTIPQSRASHPAGIHVAPTAPLQALLAPGAPAARHTASQEPQPGDAQLARSQLSTAPVGSLTFMPEHAPASASGEVDLEGDAAADPAPMAGAAYLRSSAPEIAELVPAQPPLQSETPEPAAVTIDSTTALTSVARASALRARASNAQPRRPARAEPTVTRARHMFATASSTRAQRRERRAPGSAPNAYPTCNASPVNSACSTPSEREQRPKTSGTFVTGERATRPTARRLTALRRAALIRRLSPA